jgi:lipopolysaccharide/colanic/teichoic acid biosynthesis glycosyltransferase
VASAGLVALSPVLAVAALAVWLGDRCSPLYLAPRAGRNGKPFTMYKLRTMRVGADRTGVTSTSADDNRITRIGLILRRYKLDEVPQLVNVLLGSMSLVGPRPQVISAVEAYTDEERGLLAVRPGITDYASIVFSDEGEILGPYADAGAAYDLLIRPGKSELGLFYVTTHRFSDDLRILAWTVQAIANRPSALRRVSRHLVARGARAPLAELALRQTMLHDDRLDRRQSSSIG